MYTKGPLMMLRLILAPGGWDELFCSKASNCKKFKLPREEMLVGLGFIMYHNTIPYFHSVYFSYYPASISHFSFYSSFSSSCCRVWVIYYLGYSQTFGCKSRDCKKVGTHILLINNTSYLGNFTVRNYSRQTHIKLYSSFTHSCLKKIVTIKLRHL
jgi:hypothetical protein